MGSCCSTSNRVHPAVDNTNRSTSSLEQEQAGTTLQQSDFEQQCYDGRSQLSIKHCEDFQQQFYEGKSTFDLKQHSNFQQQVYSNGSRPSSAKPQPLHNDNYPPNDIMMIVEMAKNIEHTLKARFGARGDNMCKYI